MNTRRRLSSARETLLSTLPRDISLHGQPSEPRFTHVPASHAKALHPDAQVVVGMRGAWRLNSSSKHRPDPFQRVPPGPNPFAHGDTHLLVPVRLVRAAHVP